MRTTSKLLKSLAVLSALLPFCTSGLASIVYDNTDPNNDLNRTYGPNNVQFGNQITLAGTDRVITDFQFEYFLSGNANGNETLQLQLLNNDGPLTTVTLANSTQTQVHAPGSVFYTSPVTSQPLSTGFAHTDVYAISVPAPDTFTWVVKATGIDPGEVFGLRVNNPPTTGSAFSDFWQNNNGTWNAYLFSDPSGPATFAARVTAVPEPTTFACALLAGLSWIAFLGYKRRCS